MWVHNFKQANKFGICKTTTCNSNGKSCSQTCKKNGSESSPTKHESRLFDHPRETQRRRWQLTFKNTRTARASSATHFEMLQARVRRAVRRKTKAERQCNCGRTSPKPLTNRRACQPVIMLELETTIKKISLACAATNLWFSPEHTPSSASLDTHSVAVWLAFTR